MPGRVPPGGAQQPQQRPATRDPPTLTDPVLVPGLAGIPAAKSSISFIDGTAGILAYRGHRIEVLAEHSNYEETCFLILEGRLPTASELETFRGDLAARRGIGPAVVQTLRSLTSSHVASTHSVTQSRRVSYSL